MTTTTIERSTDLLSALREIFRPVRFMTFYEKDMGEGMRCWKAKGPDGETLYASSLREMREIAARHGAEVEVM